MKHRFHTLRRILGPFLILLFIGLPFLRVNGESAFRFDIPSLQLLFFGARIGMADFFLILVALIFLTFFTLFVTAVFGRIWCGWLCPQTALADATSFVESMQKRGVAAKIAGAAAVFGISMVISASLIGYFVAPSDIPGHVKTGGTAANVITGSWAALTLILFFDLALLRRKFCATACPYAKMQSVLFDDRTLLVTFDRTRAAECMGCEACVKACPVGIDIRKGAQIECIHCAECVDACAERMAGRGKKTLVDYAFGIAGSRGTGLRMNPVITGTITLLSLLFFVSLAASRMPFDVTIRLNYTPDRERKIDGAVTNMYELSFRNLTEDNLALDLHGSVPGADVSVFPKSVMLPGNRDILRVPVAITLSSRPAEKAEHEITLTVTSQKLNKRVSKTVYFMPPNN